MQGHEGVVLGYKCEMDPVEVLYLRVLDFIHLISEWYLINIRSMPNRRIKMIWQNTNDQAIFQPYQNLLLGRHYIKAIMLKIETDVSSKGPSIIVDIFLYDNSYHNSLTPSPLSLR